MERLSHIIQLVVSQGLWKPISLSRGGPKITHLGFVDDFFLFVEASMTQEEVINKCLNVFCASSGQKGSHEKIYFSNNVNHVRAHGIASAFGFYLTHNLGKYHGVLLHHHQATSNSFSYVIERLMQKLSTWKASSLSFAGLLVLCKSIISSMPTYAMQTSLLPSKIYEKMDNIYRHYLWGDTNERKKLHLVS